MAPVTGSPLQARKQSSPSSRPSTHAEPAFLPLPHKHTDARPCPPQELLLSICWLMDSEQQWKGRTIQPRAPLTMPRPTRRAQQLQHREACIAAIKRSGDYVDYVAQHFARRPLTPNPRKAQVTKRAWETSVFQWRKDLRQPSAEGVWAAWILAHLWHQECPECGCEGLHDGDCTRDWPGGGRGISGDLPPFRGTELLGLMQLAKQMHLRTEGSPQSATHFPGAQSAA